MATELIQIVYDNPEMTAEERAKECYPCARIYKNENLTVFFENSLIAKFVMETRAKKIGVCSWALRRKQRGFYIGRARPITQEVIDGDYDILSFTKNTKYHIMLAAAAQSHKFFQPTFDKILAKIGKSRPHEVKNPIYQNHFCARTDIYRDYVSKWLIPAMDVMESDPEIRELCFKDSNYSNLTGQSAEHLEKQLGIRYYPMHAFILERLFSVYHNVMGIRVTYNDQVC